MMCVCVRVCAGAGACVLFQMHGMTPLGGAVLPARKAESKAGVKASKKGGGFASHVLLRAPRFEPHARARE